MKETKFCPYCKTTLPVALFGKSKNRGDGFQYACRKCRNERKILFNKNKLDHLRSILAQGCCVDCGESDIRVLEFDHVTDDKIEGVFRMVRSGHPLEKILREIDKCEIRCCNCHRKKTLERAGADYWRIYMETNDVHQDR